METSLLTFFLYHQFGLLLLQEVRKAVVAALAPDPDVTLAAIIERTRDVEPEVNMRSHTLLQTFNTLVPGTHPDHAAHQPEAVRSGDSPKGAAHAATSWAVFAA